MGAFARLKGLLGILLVTAGGGVVGFFQNHDAVPTTLDQLKSVAFGATVAGAAAVYGWFKDPPNRALVEHQQELLLAGIKAHLTDSLPPPPKPVADIDHVQVAILTKVNEIHASLPPKEG